MKTYILGVLVTCLIFFATAKGLRSANQLGLFNVVQFKNDVCTGNGNRNGTCYTEDECRDRDGEAMGSCASGYGVCCITMLQCGDKSAENNTYLIQESTSKPSTSCSYRICPCSKSICRMRFEFTRFEIAGPNSADLTTSNEGIVGDCSTDKFSIAVTGSAGSPVICGKNSNQHIYVDIHNNECAIPSFLFGSDTSTSRFYDITVRQYECNDDMGGPQGCLQYHTSISGVMATFNYPIGTSTLARSGDGQVTHIGEQHYTICVRRASGFCSICYYPTITSPTDAASFGLSASAIATMATMDTECSTDYIVIREAVASATIANTMTGFSFGKERICGRVFSTTVETAAIAYGTTKNSICSGARPFQIEVKFDQNETSGATTDDTTTEHGIADVPNGILGFSLDYAQQKCT